MTASYDLVAERCDYFSYRPKTLMTLPPTGRISTLISGVTLHFSVTLGMFEMVIVSPGSSFVTNGLRPERFFAMRKRK
ncbi:MAG: hypothetical protein M0Z96_04895 [Actinomycetota bacterium]|nr:hypothetical protein [Actinomycetota bacterium]